MTTLSGVISYPTSPYQNVPIHAEFYLPSRFVISNVTLGSTTLVTTGVNHNYVIGQVVRLIIPPSFGCRQLNERQGIVLSVPNPNQVVLAINSLVNVDQFFASSSLVEYPQILAICDVNTGQTNTNPLNYKLNIPGSFQNISPL